MFKGKKEGISTIILIVFTIVTYGYCIYEQITGKNWKIPSIMPVIAINMALIVFLEFLKKGKRSFLITLVGGFIAIVLVIMGATSKDELFKAILVDVLSMIGYSMSFFNIYYLNKKSIKEEWKMVS